MSKNILGINPCPHHPLGKITDNVFNTLKDNKNQNIEVQFKYAQLKYFCPSGLEQFFQKQRPDYQKQCSFVHDFVGDQNYLHLETLKKLSFQNVVLLNDLGKRVYKVQSQFNEFKHRRFYHMRDFLIKLCKENTSPQSNTHHIYQQFAKVSQNSKIKMLVNNQLRLDIIIFNSDELDGRYTYTPGQSWVRVKKQLIMKQQLDIMMSERIFRLAINQEKVSQVSFTDLTKIQAKINKPNNCMVRLKRALRVLKKDQIEISLSQVYEPKKSDIKLPQLGQVIVGDIDDLNEFLIQKFQRFYAQDNEIDEAKYQVESEFTRKGMEKIHKYIKDRHFSELRSYLEVALQDLYSLFHTEHATKVKQIAWLNKLTHGEINVEGRLDNEYGTYMRDLIYEKMQEQKKHYK